MRTMTDTKKPKRIRIETYTVSGEGRGYAEVHLDGQWIWDFEAPTEAAAKCKAQTWLRNLIKHFREGGE